MRNLLLLVNELLDVLFNFLRVVSISVILPFQVCRYKEIGNFIT